MQRVWSDSEAGLSLTCSLLVRPALPPERTPILTLATAVAAAETIAEFGPVPGIKWPNDVVIAGRKCVGILCELVSDPAGTLCVIVGAGFNLNQSAFSGELQSKATSLLMETGREVDRRVFLCHYLRQMERVLDTVEREGFAGIMLAYTARSVTLGSRVEVIGAAETFLGIAQAVDHSGALMVRDGQGVLRRVLSADVSVRGVMGYV